MRARIGDFGATGNRLPALLRPFVPCDVEGHGVKVGEPGGYPSTALGTNGRMLCVTTCYSTRRAV